MIALDITQIKKIQVDILNFAKFICNENKLTYYLCGGTLLGAVRHHGYIPWDDDIDIALKRDDYEKFINILSKYSARFKIYTYNSPYYPYLCAKLADTHTLLIENNNSDTNIGINIDIFPIDSVPKNIFLTTLIYIPIYILIHIHTAKVTQISRINNIPKKIMFMIVKHMFSFLKPCKIAYLIDILANKKYDSQFCGRITMGYQLKQIVPCSVYSSTIMLDFEDSKYSCPIGYDILLKKVYGDYMKLPPKNKQKSNHDILAYYKQKQ